MDKLNNEVGARRLLRRSKPKRKKIKKFLSLLFVVILGFGAGTQWVAHLFKYNQVLGYNFNGVYPPWKILLWAEELYKNLPNVFYQSFGVVSVVIVLGMLAILIFELVQKNSSSDDPFLHGSAEWARAEDVLNSGLLPKRKTFLGIPYGKTIGGTGVYVGAWVDKKNQTHYLRHSGAEHILTYAPTRSGKGVGLVIPTLLSWDQSAIITDLKGELWALTAGWRQKYANNEVIKFEPAAELSAKWNPLDEIRIGTHSEIGDVQNLATLIVDESGKGLQSHWDKSAQALLVGLILHVLYTNKTDKSQPATIAQVDAILSNPERPVQELWEEMATTLHIRKDQTEEVHPVIARVGRDMLDREGEELASVISTTKTYLSLYRDPIVEANTSRSDFRIKDLMHHDKPVSLYIVTQPNDKTRLRPLVRVLINMVVRLLADRMDFEDGRPVAHYKHRLLAMMDEFPSLGKLEIIQESLAFLAGYGVKFYIICQDINQLKSRETGYGENEQISSNCHVQNAYPPNRVDTAEYLSKMTGVTTVIKENITTSGKRTGLMHGGVTRNIQPTQRPLLTADEAMRLPAPVKNDDGEIVESGDMLVFVAGLPAIYGKQPLYFQDPVFLARAKVAAPTETDVIRGVEW